MSIIDWLFGWMKPKVHTNLSLSTEESTNNQNNEPVILPERQAVSKEEDTYIGNVLNNRYLIKEKLGQGGLGIVYLAQDLLFNPAKPVAVKMLLDSKLADDWIKNKFPQEIEALSKIEHPFIVNITDKGIVPDGSRPYFVMQYIKGRSLRKLIQQQSPIELNLAAQIILQISQGIDAAHKQNIYHRDLKPENIILEQVSQQSELVKIIDFGIARVEKSEFGETQTPRAVGTRGYMAPEQFWGQVSAETDTYALGVIAYELIFGHHPINFEDNMSLTSMRPDLAPAARETINRAMSYDFKARHPSILEFGEEFVRATSGVLSEKPKSKSQNQKDIEIQKTPSSVTPTSEESILLESVKGAVHLNSPFYIVRPADHKLDLAISNKREIIILVKGARQMGKTSLVARGLQRARTLGSRVIATDVRAFSPRQLESIDSLFKAFASCFEDYFDLNVSIDKVWRDRRSATMNFTKYIEKEVLEKYSEPIVWVLDQVDLLFSQPYSNEVFGYFRSLHDDLNNTPIWNSVTLIITYSTEANLFIKNINQSPFNVGTEILLADFSMEQVSELNERYKKPLKSEHEIKRFFDMVGGHPYLVRRGLHELVANKMQLYELLKQATYEDGPFGDHLQRLLLMAKDPKVHNTLVSILDTGYCKDSNAFYALRSAGIVSGNTSEGIKPRCHLYGEYLTRNLCK